MPKSSSDKNDSSDFEVREFYPADSRFPSIFLRIRKVVLLIYLNLRVELSIRRK
jgi:hypothetical protein